MSSVQIRYEMEMEHERNLSGNYLKKHQEREREWERNKHRDEERK